MMIKKVEFFCWGFNWENQGFREFFCGSSHFSASQHPRTPPKLQNSSIWVSYDIPPNFKPRYWHENFIVLRKIKISSWCWAKCLVYF